MLILLFVLKPKTAYDVRIRAWSSDVCSSVLVLDLVGRQLPEAVGGEAGEHVALQVAAIGLLSGGRQPTTEREELLRPDREWHLSVTWIDPQAANTVRLDLPEDALGVGLAGEGPRLNVSKRVRK